MGRQGGSILVDPLAVISTIVLLTISQMAYAYDPQPDKAVLMVIHAHPDDEGIFFGGTLPYYTQVKRVPTALVDMTTGWLNSDGSQTSNSLTREVELNEVAWRYGLRNEPIFAFFQQTNWQMPISESWDRWADYVTDYDDIAVGQQMASRYLAEQIRLCKPDVIVTHDFGGEYGHPDHKALAYATAAAWDLAAGNSATINDGVTSPITISPDDIAGDPWQAKKLYVHNYGHNRLFHDYWEDTTIDTTGNGRPDQTPRQVANYGMQAYPSQGTPKVATVYDPMANGGNSWDGYPSEWWSLYATVVGTDTLAGEFTIEGTTYTGWARGDFLEHIPGEIIQPKAVVSQEYVFNSALATIDNAGMLTPVVGGVGGTSLVSALAATHRFGSSYDASYASTNPGGSSDFFASIGPDTDVDIVYDLTGGRNTDIGSVILWQYENNGGGGSRNVGNHARTIEIRVNAEAQGSATFGGPATTVMLLPVTDSDADPDNDLGGVSSAQFFVFDPLENGRYAQLSITDNYLGFQGITIGGDRVGLGEVRFAGAQSACANRPAGDFNGDCVQDLRDLAIWASTYLDCGIEPASACP